MATNKQIATATALVAAIAAPAEGLRQWAYRDDGPGILTACRGHTGSDVKQGVKYSLAQCDAWFTDDMRKAIAIVDKCQPGLPVEVLAAFSDAAFNMGPKIACSKEHSTAARYLYAGRLIDGCNQLVRWDRANVMGVSVALPGLTKRREAERKLCLIGANNKG